MNSQKRTPYFLILWLLVAGCFLISPAANAGDTSSESSEEVSQLLSQVKTEAIALERDSEDLAAWTGAKQMSWESHAGKLNEIKDHVNQAGRLLRQLNEASGTASPWQQQAIDRIYPLLKELADNTEMTINHFNDNKDKIHFSAYAEYAKAGYELAHDLAALVSDYVEYGNLEVDFHRLQEKLDSTAS
jgi:trans-aconitate methyltransferase